MGVFVVRPLLFGVYIRAPCFGKLKSRFSNGACSAPMGGLQGILAGLAKSTSHPSKLLPSLARRYFRAAVKKLKLSYPNSDTILFTI